MTAPTSPYTTSAAVAVLLTTPLKNAAEFSPLSTPKKTAVDEIIGWVSSQIDLQFSMAGYVLPFQPLSGETWPSHQTAWLGLVATLGAAAMAGGYSLKPAPALAPSQQGRSGNALQDLYTAELEKIFNHQTRRSVLRFRAQYYACTPAEDVLVIPKGPTTDYLEGKYDPMRFLPLYEMADRVIHIQNVLANLGISWDYLYGLFDFNRGLGADIYQSF